MAPTKKTKSKISIPSYNEIKDLIYRILFDPSLAWVVASLLFILEIFVNVVVIWKVAYTEIDWQAYMEEVEGFINGTRDYELLKGGTGPLVYPAGFVYVFSILYYITSYGTNIRLAQYLFAFLYMATLATVFYIYIKGKKLPPYVFFFMCCASYRIHSIFILRLFNDPVAMLFLYISIICFLKDHWNWGCLLYSFAVSIKMNVLLFAPGLLVLLLLKFSLLQTILKLSICASLQLVLAVPFLLENPVGYMARSFNLGRQFFYIWTVNWRLIPEWLFLNRIFQVSLLLLHAIVLLYFVFKKWPRPTAGWFSVLKGKFTPVPVSSNTIIFVMFSSNFIGMCFSRSLHYQFYVWYFHTLPFLLWSIKVPDVARLLILGMIEMCWNTYPSTVTSSFTLHVCHLFILTGIALCPLLHADVKREEEFKKE